MSDPFVAEQIIEQVEAFFNLDVNVNGQVHRISFFKMVGALSGGRKMVYDDNSLMFFVDTAKLQGKVIIKLNGMDLYDVEFWKHKDLVGDKPTKVVNDVFFDQLTNILREELGV